MTSAPATLPKQPAPCCPVISSADLFGAARMLTISHKDESYRLQITATGKLILTK